MSALDEGETPIPEAAPQPFSPFKNSVFLRFWLMRCCSSSTSQILTVAIGWQVYALSHDPLDLGLVGLFQFIPAVLLALPAGHAIDRYPRRTVLRLAISVNHSS